MAWSHNRCLTCGTARVRAPTLTSFRNSLLRTFILPIISPRIIIIVAYVVKDGRGIHQLIIILE